MNSSNNKIIEVTYYNPKTKQKTITILDGSEPWRVEAFVQKLRREGKVIRDVKTIVGTRPVDSQAHAGGTAAFDCDLIGGSLLQAPEGQSGQNSLCEDASQSAGKG